MKTLITIGCVVAVMFCTIAQAQESSAVTCQNGNLSRTVEITYAGEQGKPPCEVHYKKTTEEPGHDQVLWSAEHKSGYCESKKQEFVEKLTNWGWNCQ